LFILAVLATFWPLVRLVITLNQTQIALKISSFRSSIIQLLFLLKQSPYKYHVIQLGGITADTRPAAKCRQQHFTASVAAPSRGSAIGPWPPFLLIFAGSFGSGPLNGGGGRRSWAPPLQKSVCANATCQSLIILYQIKIWLQVLSVSILKI